MKNSALVLIGLLFAFSTNSWAGNLSCAETATTRFQCVERDGRVTPFHEIKVIASPECEGGVALTKLNGQPKCSWHLFVVAPRPGIYRACYGEVTSGNWGYQKAEFVRNLGPWD